VGHVTSSTLFDHRQFFESPNSGPVQRLEGLQLQTATLFGGRAALSIAGRWRLYGDAAHGGTDYDYFDRAESAAGLRSGLEVRSRAAITTLELGVERQIPLLGWGTHLGVALGGAVHRYRVGDGRGRCITAPPSVGMIWGQWGQCPKDHWERAYWGPGAVGGLTLGQALTRHLGVEIGARYSLGRVDTENFGRAFIPEFQHLNPPSSFRISTTQLSAGVTVRL
jgi:hypothetical protein